MSIVDDSHDSSQVNTSQEYKLCYVDDGFAWFTTAALEDQWGDDWNDAPYEHNAGTPYSWVPYMAERENGAVKRYELCKLAFECPLETPGEIASWQTGNSQYSVQMINRGLVAWLAPDKWTFEYNPKIKAIMAGVSIEEFKHLIWLADGEVYERVERPQQGGDDE